MKNYHHKFVFLYHKCDFYYTKDHQLLGARLSDPLP